jgi:hypothetical protein
MSWDGVIDNAEKLLDGDLIQGPSRDKKMREIVYLDMKTGKEKVMFEVYMII